MLRKHEADLNARAVTTAIADGTVMLVQGGVYFLFSDCNDEIPPLHALAPMYETPLHPIALRASGIASLEALDRRRISVGPAEGPGEIFFFTG